MQLSVKPGRCEGYIYIRLPRNEDFNDSVFANMLYANAHHIRISREKLTLALLFCQTNLSGNDTSYEREEVSRPDYDCFLIVSHARRDINSFDTVSKIYLLSKN